MLNSMTGYGKGEALLETGKLTVEIRSLNGKSAEISLKSSLLPKEMELQVRKKIADALVRGTIDVYLTWEPNAATGAKAINADLAVDYYRQICELGSKLGMDDLLRHDPNILLANILRMPEVVDSRKQEIITPENWPTVDAAFDAALESIRAFRQREGAILKADVTSKVEKILQLSHEVETYEKERTEAVRSRILAKFEELGASPDPARLEQEMIFYIEKLDINEERVRLRQHCAYYLETLENEPYPGKKLGFIAQEMGREINTTGSKANHAGIQRLVVRMKDELEKIREQSMNIL